MMLSSLVPRLAALVWLWQSSLVVNLGGPARPEHLRFERPVQLRAGTVGMACFVLDAAALAHTASPAHDDLRLFRALPGESSTEVPFTLTESGPEPVADTVAQPEHVVSEGNRLSFDLRMPARPFSAVKLGLALRDFVATATVEGGGNMPGGGVPRAVWPATGSARADLGSVAVFDLSTQHLGRWTTLLLAESAWPLLHITLNLRTPGGAPLHNVGPEVLTPAYVPPSRMRQTRFVPTVSTSAQERRGRLSVALLHVPAHVPVERVRFAFPPGYNGSFAREVTLSARADHAPATDTEAIDAGLLQHVNLPSGDARLYPIALREDALDATLGATLAGPATVLVAVNNDQRPSLPIQSVTLEMRERKICFFADREGSYTLRYGDAALAAPVYDESALRLPPDPAEATLGAESINPQYAARTDRRPMMQRFPELYWLLVLLSGGLAGGAALHHLQHRKA